MPADTPLVSTIIPLYNGAATIERTLRSVCAQSTGALEILVVNDGSTDDGPGIVDALRRTDTRVQRIDRANTGLPAARNTGLARARGRYVHFLDADDTIEADAYAKFVEADRRAGTGAVVAGHEVRTMDGALIDTILPNCAEVGLDDLVDRVGFVCHAPLVRRDRIGSLEFDESFLSYEDLDFWFRLGETGLRWSVVNEPLVHYSMRVGSMSRNVAVMLAAAQDAVWNLFERQRALPAGDRLMDASLERRDRRLAHFALAYATQTVMLGGIEAVDGAVALFAGARGDKHITPEDAAEKTHHGFTYALARSYDDDLDREVDVLRPLAEFWRRCEAQGWAAPGLAADAPIHLRRLRHEHEMIAEAILDEIEGATRLTIIGYGRNGAVLARLAGERGLDVTVRDDRFDATRAARLPDWPPVESMDAPLRVGEPVVLSPLVDDALAQRFAQAEDLMRWRLVRRALFTPATLRVASS